MSLPGLSLPGSEHGVVWHALAGRVPGSRAGQDRLAKTVGARKFLSPARSVDRPVRQAAGPSIVQSFRQPVRRSSKLWTKVRQAAGPSIVQCVRQPVRQAASRPAGPRVRQPAERPAVLIAQHTAGRPAQSGVRSLGRRGTGARGLFRRAAFPRRMITMCMIDTHKKIQTELKKSYTLPCVVFGAGAWARAPPRPAQERGPPRPRARASRGPRGSTPGARRRKPSWGPSAEGKRPAGGGRGGSLLRLAHGWRTALRPRTGREKGLSPARCSPAALLSPIRVAARRTDTRGRGAGARGRLTKGQRAPWARAPGPMVP